MNRSTVRKYIASQVTSASLHGMDRQYWFFTLNNPTDYDVRYALIDVEVVFWQLERSPKHGTPHLQGVIKFVKPKTRKQVKSMLPRAHFEKIWSTFETAVGYATKSYTRIAGPWAGIGAETEITRAWKMLRSTQDALRRAIPPAPYLPATAD